MSGHIINAVRCNQTKETESSNLLGDQVTQKDYDRYASYGYGNEILPKLKAARDWGGINYFTVWMGAVHNLLSYMTVAGFFILGLSVYEVLLAIMLAACIISALYIINGYAGQKYGIGFSMLLRDIFGFKGSLIPAISRGLIAGFMFFGTKTIVAAYSINPIFNKIFPGYMDMYPDFDLLGLSFPSFISYIFIWIITIVLFLGGMRILSMFAKFSSPIIYLLIIGAAIWSIHIAGGVDRILEYKPENHQVNLLVFFACVSALVSNWGGPIVNISDLTQRAKTNSATFWGLPAGFILSYLLFAITSVGLLVGTRIAFDLDGFNIIRSIEQINNPIAVIVLLITLNIGSISYVVFGNLLPSGLQMTALMPKVFSVKTAAILTTLIGTIILPWKLVENTEALFLFYSFIGAMYGPLTGIMIASFFIEKKFTLNLDSIFLNKIDLASYPAGYNIKACLVLLLAFLIVLSGSIFNQVSILAMIAKTAFISGTIIGFTLYSLSLILKKKE